MSESVKRVEADAKARGLSIEILHLETLTKTAQQAADAIDVHIDQIAKSIIFRGATSDAVYLFLTAGGNRVDTLKAGAIAGEEMAKADAAFIRDKTGFAIGGVSPIGHTGPVRSFVDPRLSEFDVVWAAAGTPHAMFPASPADLIAATGATMAVFTT